jgi:DNA polymerase-3 subunit epsilon
MPLNLTKAIVFFDLETTGANVTQDRIVEIAALRIDPSGEEIEKHWLVNPGIPIPPVTTSIHGITDKDVENAPSFENIANEVLDFFKGSDLGGYNHIKFDVPLLMEEFNRVNINFDIKNRRLIDAQRIFFMMEPRTLSGAYKFYCQKNLVNAHSAMADTKATYEVLK